jgi:hypothetical protein
MDFCLVEGGISFGEDALNQREHQIDRAIQEQRSEADLPSRLDWSSFRGYRFANTGPSIPNIRSFRSR